MTSKFSVSSLLLLIGCVLTSGIQVSKAALNASDNAGNYSSWTSGQNQGTGFGAWSFSPNGNTGQQGEFLATPANTDLNFIATGGQAWGMYANGGQTANAVRPFTGGSLAAGQQFLVSMENGSVDTGAQVGFRLQNGSTANRFEFYFTGGGSNYKIFVNGTETDTLVGFTPNGLNLVFTQNASDGYSFTINGGSPFTGTLLVSDISQVSFFADNPGSFNNVYFNSLAVVPEPVNVALGVFGGLLGVVMVGRHWKARRLAFALA